MIRRSIIAALWAVAGVISCGAYAAEDVKSNRPTMRAYFESDSVGIGDVIRLVIDVEQDVMQSVAFPDYDLSTQEQLEMVAPPRLDTVSRDGRRVQLRRIYSMRTFDEGHYNLGRASVLYIDKGIADTIYSADSLLLGVNTYLIDSTAHSIFDVKRVRNLPFQFKEVSGYVGWGALAFVLMAIAAYIFVRLMAKWGRPVFGLFKAAPPVPPHVEALEALEKLHGQHLWQGGEVKGYYSELTDILKRYISGRYGVAACEMTTDEILIAARELDLPRRSEMELGDLLRDADLVKFAKAELAAQYNEGYFVTAKGFVEQTMEQENLEQEGEQ